MGLHASCLLLGITAVPSCSCGGSEAMGWDDELSRMSKGGLGYTWVRAAKECLQAGVKCPESTLESAFL